MSYMMNAYLNNAFYYAMLDSAAGEQGARRNAMKSATDNANEMVSTLERIYNTVRQGAITTEITEIVGGTQAAPRKHRSPAVRFRRGPSAFSQTADAHRK